tara:strand:- start:31 stop:363 length:333 start_codon:yes stop_codon:yes gene_type:complete
MDIKIEQKEGHYYVHVKIPEYNSKTKRKTIVGTGAVRAEMKSRGHDLGQTIQESYLHNLNKIVAGTWIFEKKVLDKSPEPVILKEEKSVQPKPKRVRRTRSSTKKISTEE